MNFTWNSHQINFMGYLRTRISLKLFLKLDITKAYHIPFTWKSLHMHEFLVIKILALSGQTSWSRFGCLWWTRIFRPSTGCVVPWCPGNWPMSTVRRLAARWTFLTVRWCHSLGGSCGIYDLCSSTFQASSSCPQRRTNH